jgi:hypothetical protein
MVNEKAKRNSMLNIEVRKKKVNLVIRNAAYASED